MPRDAAISLLPEARVGRPLRPHLPRVAVVGAGVSGLICARALGDHGYPVRVFDKGRRPGGRMSTREHGERSFDHGAQFFTARDPRFRRYVESWREDGVVGEWRGRIVHFDEEGRRSHAAPDTRWVGTPSMQSLARHLAEDVDVRTGIRITDLERSEGVWRLRADDGEDAGEWDIVVVSAPAPQTAALLPPDSSVRERASGVALAPCWAVMLELDGHPALDADAAFVRSGPLSWLARNGSKPGRPRPDCWVLHGSPEWSEEHLELEPEEAADVLIDAFGAVAGPLPGVLFRRAHRWRYALPPAPLPEACIADPDERVVACGDWCGGPRVEGAFLSGAAAAGRILGWLDAEGRAR
jgi:predicted NAD/FAD-dependent oxidoreductase